MKKLILLAAIAVTALGAAAPAPAATANVTITKAGYLPSTVTIRTGDSVAFTNTDTAAHQVVFSKTTGVTCTPNPLVLQATQGGSCSFATAGTYAYHDAQNKKMKGTVVVQGAPSSVTLTVSPVVVVYGGHATLSGTVSNHAVGEKVTIDAQQCGESSSKTLANVTTTTGGAFSYTAQPLMQTTYTARWKSTTSPAATVRVRPRIHVGRVAPHRYSVRVYSAQSLAGKVISFQRYNRSRGTWITVKRVPLVSGPSAVAPTIVSAATVRVRVPARTRVRVVLPSAQAAPCYLAGTSNVIFS
jgi:plastocyanin